MREIGLPANQLFGGRPWLVPIGLAITVVLLGAPPAILGVLDARLSAGLGVAVVSIFAGSGAITTASVSRRSSGIEARFWRWISWGLTSWTLGSLPYVAFLATEGDLRHPAAWSQIGFLLAYPFWYRAFWLLRQPALEESRRARVETLLIELSVFGLIALVVIGALWYPALPAAENVAQLVPISLDLLLLAALYNAIRRSAVTHRAAFIWFVYAFGGLALTDGAITLLVTRGASIVQIGGTMLGYVAAMGMVSIAARRPLRVTEAQATLGISKPLLAAVGLALAGPASALAPALARPAVWALAALLFWRLCTQLRVHGESDVDGLTGFLTPPAFVRHVAGVIQAASSARPAVVVAVDLDDFGRWNGQNGYAAGDLLLADIATRLEGSELSGGVWCRTVGDRFAWIGIGHDTEAARSLAEIARGVAAANSAELTARATFVMLPDDATVAVNAMAAVEEGLAAAKSGDRLVVAFDRGRLDGVDYAAGYTASLAQRREAITQILLAPETISTVFQPIVALDDGRTVGFESLSRFRAEPQRPPDRWIAEAHAVGLGLEIEVECVRRAYRLRHTIPAGAYLSVNMSPDAILAPEMEDALGTESLEGLVIEITEHDAVSDYARLAARLADYRGRGAKVAIDDAGAGHASMRHVTQLSPDYIKIDRSLIHDIHLDYAKRALVRSMVTLEKDLGAAVVAEGIESADELRTLRELGVPFGQGYLLARPHGTATPAPWSSTMLDLADAPGTRAA